MAVPIEGCKSCTLNLSIMHSDLFWYKFGKDRWSHLMLGHLLHNLCDSGDWVSLNVVFRMLLIRPDVSQHLQRAHNQLLKPSATTHQHGDL